MRWLLETVKGSYVGDLGFTLSNLWGSCPENNWDRWFKGAHVYYVHTARTAIRQVCSFLKLGDRDEVLVPAYNCGSEVDALLAGGASVRFYRVTETAEIDLEDVCRRITGATKAIYVIHYFGFPQPLAPLANFCRNKGLFLIEDCALSTLTEVEGRRIGQVGDIAVYNFPKVLPVPDGGAMVINNSDLQADGWTLQPPPFRGLFRNTLQLFRQGLLRSLPNTWAGFLDGVIRGDTKDDFQPGSGRRKMPDAYQCHPALANRAISKFSAATLKHIDFSEVRIRRRRNYSRLLGILSQHSGVTPLYRALPDGVCPLSLPILVKPARKLAFRLFSSSIPAPPWWSGYNCKCSDWDAFPEACYLKDHLVALPVHHQLMDSAIEFIAARVVESLAAA